MTTTPFGDEGDFDTGLAMARQSDGKLVLAGNADGGFSFGSGGDFALARYNTNGTLDTSFGGDGRVTTDFAPPGNADEAWAVAIQPDGKIVAAGIAEFGGGDAGDFAVARYNTDGSPDTTFSDDGKATVDFVHDDARGVAIQGTKIVVVGFTGSDFALARLNSDGTPDNTFDTDGKVTTPMGGEANAVAVSVDKIIVAGWANGGSTGRDFALARYNDNGSLDTTFDGDGKVTTPISTQTIPLDEARALSVQTDGKLVAAGEANMSPDHFALVRYNTDGSLDTGFDGDGKVTTSLSPIGTVSRAHALAIQADGKLVAAGSANNSDGSETHQDFALARYNANGSLDTTFDADGKVTTEIAPTPQIDIARAVVVQPDGKAVAAGYADMGPPEFADFDFAIVRHHPNGDDVPPAAPAVTDTDPDPPSNDNAPRVRGTADAGSTVKLYGNPSCSGTSLGQGSAAAFASPGVVGTVPSDQTTTFYAAATDGSGHTSGCSTSSVQYVEDSTAPAAPTLTGTEPPSPADNPSPRVKGTAEAGSTVKVFRACHAFATPIAQGTAAELASPGIQVSAFEGAGNGFSATATDAAGNTSACSATLTYVELNPQTSTQPPPGGATIPTAPTFPNVGPGAQDDGGAAPRIAAPRGSAGTATVNRRGVFTVPRTVVTCVLDGGVCDVLVRVSAAGRVRLRTAQARVTLGSAAFTVEEGERSGVKIRLSRRIRSVLRRLRRVRAVTEITVTNLRERTATRTVRFTLRARRG